ncbi:EKC/KEOPS complex [Salix suchowensis]|nr:EKC/KEOPS complex [Salix suchowensis]
MAAAAMDSQWISAGTFFSYLSLPDFEVDFRSEENASIIYAALAVDKELQPDKVKRLMSVSNGKLSAHFEAVEARFLRASFSAFVDVLTLTTKTIEEFGKEMAS